MSFVSPGSHIFVDIFVDNYNGVNSYIFVNGNKHINSNYKLEIYKFKAKDSEINVVPICLGTVSKKDISVYTMTKTGWYGHVCDLSVDYDSIDVDDTLDIHKCLMKKHIKLCLD